jgi:hypothetical protein
VKLQQKRGEKNHFFGLFDNPMQVSDILEKIISNVAAFFAG